MPSQNQKFAALTDAQVTAMFPGAPDRYTPAEMRTLLVIVDAVAEAIRDMPRGVPSGHLYAALMGTLSPSMYQSVLGLLKRAKLIEERGHYLRWTGPR